MVAEKTKYPWAKASVEPAREFGMTHLPVLTGQLPSGLQGTLYRNGPGRLGRGAERVGHWFDGDGAILAVHFGDGGAQGAYRYVQTEGLQAEEEAHRYLYGNYGMTPASLLPWERWTRLTKNCANTSVLALEDRLLALWEGGNPHALDLDTLETRGIDTLGRLGQAAYSAHPKREAATGDIYNFGLGLGLDATLNLYRSDASGQVIQKGSIPLQGVPLIHDFVLAGDYLVFCVPPVRISPLPVALTLTSFSDAMQWEPERGTAIYIVDRRTLSLLARSEAPAWYQWHFSNGYQDEASGELVIDLCRYEDFATNTYLKEYASGFTRTPARSTLWQLRLDPTTGRVNENRQVLDRPCEFPTVEPDRVGRQARHVYLSVHRQGADIASEIFQSVGRFDRETGELTEANLEEGFYPSEPLYAPDANQPGRGWVLATVYDSRTHQSEVWIWRAEGLSEAPVCRLGLPEVVPPGFHGTWKGRNRR